MRKSEAKEILTKMKQNYLNLEYLKGVSDEKERWRNKIREDIDKLSDQDSGFIGIGELKAINKKCEELGWV